MTVPGSSDPLSLVALPAAGPNAGVSTPTPINTSKPSTVEGAGGDDPDPDPKEQKSLECLLEDMMDESMQKGGFLTSPSPSPARPPKAKAAPKSGPKSTTGRGFGHANASRGRGCGRGRGRGDADASVGDEECGQGFLR